MNTDSVVQPGKAGSGWSIVWGILMVICGFLAIAVPFASSIAIALLFAWLILFAGVAHLIFAFHGHTPGGVLWQRLLVVAYGAAGIYLLMHPLLGILSLTLLLAVFFLFEAALELALYVRIRHRPRAGWILFDGIVTLILGILVWMHWPSNSVWVIGTLVGISLIFSGISRFMLAFTARDGAKL